MDLLRLIKLGLGEAMKEVQLTTKEIETQGTELENTIGASFKKLQTILLERNLGGYHQTDLYHHRYGLVPVAHPAGRHINGWHGETIGRDAVATITPSHIRDCAAGLCAFLYDAKRRAGGADDLWRYHGVTLDGAGLALGAI